MTTGSATMGRPKMRKRVEMAKKPMAHAVVKTKASGKPQKARRVGRKVARKSVKRLVRKDLRRPVDTNETHVDVQRALTKAKGSPELKGALALNRNSIVVAEKVFQWRLLDTDVVNREDHILDMANAVVDSNKPLDAILVFPVGDKFYVVDGHHRLAAYHTARWIGPIPATVFSGTLEEAYLGALSLNSRNKLSMTKSDKQEAAWKLVKLGGLSKVQIRELTSVATSNVANMRRVLRKLQELKRPEGAIPIADLTWRRALREDYYAPEDGRKEWDADEWKEREATKIVEALMKANIGFMLKEQPEITAMALEKLHDKLPEALMKEWVHRLDPEFLVGFIREQLDEEAAQAWTAMQEPKRF
jgi:hypothetical protein